MRLDELTFLFLFLPLFLAVYYITPDKEKALTLLVGSVLFFAFQEGVDRWQYLAMGVLLPVTFWSGKHGRRKRWAVPVGLLALVGVWASFALRGTVLFGMRFYLLQMAAYLLAAGRGQCFETEFHSYGTQILMFPKLQYGPLVEPERLMEQVHAPKVRSERVREGSQDLLIGLSRKVLLADTLESLAERIGDSALLPMSWVWVALRAMGLYFRFWGYGTMAVGIGKLLGYELPESFREPWTADSVSDHFSRWNVTLWRWLERELMSIRVLHQQRGVLFFVMGVSMGLWYGPSRRLLLWGIIMGMVMAAEQGSIRRRKGNNVGRKICTILTVMLGWGIFFVDDPGRLLRWGGSGMDPWSALGSIVGMLFCSPLPMRWVERYRERIWFDILLFVSFWVCVWFLV